MQPNEIEFWIDVNLPPALANWLQLTFGVRALSFEELNLLTAPDNLVYKLAADAANTVIITTKDIDYVQLSSVKKKPSVLLISTGNISNKQLKAVLMKAFPQAVQQFLSADYHNIIEITK